MVCNGWSSSAILSGDFPEGSDRMVIVIFNCNFFVLFLTRQVGQHVKGKQLITVINDGSLRKLLHTKKLNST